MNFIYPNLLICSILLIVIIFIVELNTSEQLIPSIL